MQYVFSTFYYIIPLYFSLFNEGKISPALNKLHTFLRIASIVKHTKPNLKDSL